MEKQEVYLVYLSGIKDYMIFLLHKDLMDWIRSVKKIPADGIDIPEELIEKQVSLGKYGGSVAVEELETIYQGSIDAQNDILLNIGTQSGLSRKEVYDYLSENKDSIVVIDEIEGLIY